MKKKLTTLLFATLLLPLFAAVSFAGTTAVDHDKVMSPSTDQQLCETYRQLKNKFSRQGDQAAELTLERLKSAFEIHQNAQQRALFALDDYAEKKPENDRLEKMKSQMEQLQQSLRDQYLLQMLWLQPEFYDEALSLSLPAESAPEQKGPIESVQDGNWLRIRFDAHDPHQQDIE